MENLSNELDQHENLGGATCTQEDGAYSSSELKKKVPRRLIHYTDGTIEEEYSTDEEEPPPPPPPPVDTSKLSWPQWVWHFTKVTGVRTLAGADFCGEKLAWFFGITSPKYQYIIDEYQKLKAEEKEEREQEEYEMRQYLEQQKGSLAHVEEGSEPVTAVNLKGTSSVKEPANNTDCSC